MSSIARACSLHRLAAARLRRLTSHVPRLVTVVIRIVARCRKRRHDQHQLHRMSERQLRDLGLSRTELRRD